MSRKLNSACFNIYDANKRHHLTLSSLELLFLPFFSLPPSNYFIFQKTAIIKSLFLKKKWLLELSSTEHPLQFIGVYDGAKLSLWSRWANSWSLKWVLGCLSWLPHKFIVRLTWNSIWKRQQTIEMSESSIAVDPTPLWDLTIYLFWKTFKIFFKATVAGAASETESRSEETPVTTSGGYF